MLKNNYLLIVEKTRCICCVKTMYAPSPCEAPRYKGVICNIIIKTFKSLFIQSLCLQMGVDQVVDSLSAKNRPMLDGRHTSLRRICPHSHRLVYGRPYGCVFGQSPYYYISLCFYGWLVVKHRPQAFAMKEIYNTH